MWKLKGAGVGDRAVGIKGRMRVGSLWVFNQMPFGDNKDAITCAEMVPSCVPDSLLWNVGGL